MIKRGSGRAVIVPLVNRKKRDEKKEYSCSVWFFVACISTVVGHDTGFTKRRWSRSAVSSENYAMRSRKMRRVSRTSSFVIDLRSFCPKIRRGMTGTLIRILDENKYLSTLLITIDIYVILSPTGRSPFLSLSLSTWNTLVDIKDISELSAQT